MSKSTEAGPIRLALKIEDPALADRLAKLLASVPGLQLVGAGESADVTLLHSNGVSGPVEGDVPLTPRELEVSTLLAGGLSNKAIARRLGISVHTAKFHVGALIDKLDAIGRTDAVAPSWRNSALIQTLAWLRADLRSVGTRSCLSLSFGWQDFLSAYLIDQVFSFEIGEMRSLFVVGQICADPLRHHHDQCAVIHVHPIPSTDQFIRRVANEWTARIDR